VARYCVKCGRSVEPDEMVESHGVCVDCYLKYYGLFIEKPVVKIVVCPKCGSWRYRGVWHKPVDHLEAFRRVLLNEYGRYVDRSISLIDANALEKPLVIRGGRYRVRMEFTVLFNNSLSRKTVEELEYVVEKKLCPRCIASASKSHKALLQIRGENGVLRSRDRFLVEKILGEPGVVEDVVEVSMNKHGIDVKVYSLEVARKIVSMLVRSTGAKVVESFKPVKYDSRSGRWSGVSTISIRIPSVNAGDLVEYMGRPGIVRDVGLNGVVVELFDDGSRVNISYEVYWKGILKKPPYMVVDRVYRVIGYDSSSIYLLNEETGEMREYPRSAGLYDLRNGDVVYLIKVGDKEYIVRKTVES